MVTSILRGCAGEGIFGSNVKSPRVIVSCFANGLPEVINIPKTPMRVVPRDIRIPYRNGK